MVKTVGITCKACDRSLDAEDWDGELCNVCLDVVNDVNRDLYEQLDDDAIKLLDEFIEEISDGTDDDRCEVPL